MQTDFNAEGSERVQQLITRLGLRAKDTRAARREIGEEMMVRTADRFDRGVSPDGVPWKPSRRAEAEGGQTLLDTGTLASRIAYSTGGSDLELRATDRRARVHQLGLTIEPVNGEYLTFPIIDDDGKKSFRRVRSLKMEKRAFLGFSEDDLQMVLVILGRYFEL